VVVEQSVGYDIGLIGVGTLERKDPVDEVELESLQLSVTELYNTALLLIGVYAGDAVTLENADDRGSGRVTSLASCGGTRRRCTLDIWCGEIGLLQRTCSWTSNDERSFSLSLAESISM
jgi:hypothetical protein